MPSCSSAKLGQAHNAAQAAKAISTGRRPTRSASMPAKGINSNDTPTAMAPASSVSRIDMPVTRCTCDG
ncbi:hypothetical protein D3C71_2211460 [compost metagenome]